jgi:threonine/homoserine/homoserine lactone efflux protein
VAWLAVLSPGPAVLLTLRNSATLGLRAAMWSWLGNCAGVFCVALASMLGLGAMLKASAVLFGALKILGALYLFYVGLRYLFGRTSALRLPARATALKTPPTAFGLYSEALLLALTNPKAILFFTALFPQFMRTEAPLAPQFCLLTGVFLGLSGATRLVYALLASRAAPWLAKPRVTLWLQRTVGSVFLAFGAALLTWRRPAS